MEGVVIDTNVFVAAGFNVRSASERILAAIRDGRLQLVCNEPTRREAEFVLRRIPLLVGISSVISFGQRESLPAVSISTTLSSSKIGTIENSRRSAQQQKFHSLPMTTISWRIGILLALTF